MKSALETASIRYQQLRPPGATSDVIFVSEQQHSVAVAIVRKQTAEYAAAQRAAWQEEWRTVHKGSYWHWLRHHFTEQPKRIAFAFLNLF